MNLPLGLARVAQNVRYTAQSVGTRFGHSTQLKFGAGNSLTSGGLLRYLAAQPGTLNLQAVETILLFAYGASTGSIYSCPPFIQAAQTILNTAGFTTNSGITVPINLNPVIRQCFNNMLIALTDLLLPQGPALIYNSIDSTLYPASDLPFGAPWNPTTYYRVGQIVSPATFQTFGQPSGQGAWVVNQTGLLYRCITAGTSANAASQPVWPTGFNSTVNDGGAVWQESTPLFISGLPDPAAPTSPLPTINAGSVLIPGSTVYACFTAVNSIGEGTNQLSNVLGNLDTAKVLVYKNTSGSAIDLNIGVPAIPALLGIGGPLGATYGQTAFNCYIFVDQTSSATPSEIIDPTFYAKQNSIPLIPTQVVTIHSFPAFGQLPQTSTAATTATVGNVDTGIRYLTVFGQTNSMYQTGFSNAAAIALRVTQSGWPIQCLRLPVGPYNWNSRIVGSTVAGASAAGPFTWISQADVESPGFNQSNVQITATIVEDNVSTTALFNFTDTYLPGASNVTNFFNKIQIPPCVDVYFAKTLQRAVYTGAVGYQSGHLFSDIVDPETIRVPGGNFQVSENDGDRTVCYREIRGIGYSFKENSGFEVVTNGGDPSTWTPRQVWTGNGPAGAGAIDIAGQDDSEFAVWAHRSGLYLFAGQYPRLISREQVTDWDTINWDYGYLIKVRIDQKRRLIYILAPTNGSRTINARFVVNYYFGTGDPVVFVQRRGILVPNVEGRKWSKDPLTFNDGVYIPQKSANSVQLGGVNVENQMLFLSADGSIKNVVDNQYFDQDYSGNPVGYTDNWIGVLGTSPSTMLTKLAGARMWGTGNGLWKITAYDDNDNAYPLDAVLSPCLLTPGLRSRFDVPMSFQGISSMRWAPGMSNGGVAGSWWLVYKSDLMVYDQWPGLPG